MIYQSPVHAHRPPWPCADGSLSLPELFALLKERPGMMLDHGRLPLA